MQITIDTERLNGSRIAALLGLIASLFPAEVQAFLAQHGVTVSGKPSLELAVAQAHIDAADNPAAGTASAAEVFTQGTAAAPAAALTMTAAAQHTYEVYQQAGWTDDALIAHGYALPRAGAPVSDAARVFTGGAGGPLATSSGEQPAPSNTGATSPLQSGDAMSVFSAPSATPAPSAAPAQASAAVTATAQELDADGLPWDARIHASTRTRTAKGVWKKLRGVDDGLVAQVVSELRTAVATVKAAAFTPLNATAAPSAPPPPPPPAATAQVAPPPPPPPPTATAQVTPPPATQDEVQVSFVDVARFVGDHKITADKVTDVCRAHGIAGLALLTQHKHLAAAVLADFKKFAGVA